MIKNSNLCVLGRLSNPNGLCVHLCVEHEDLQRYIVKRERLNAPTENNYAGGGNENRRVMLDYDDMASFYTWRPI